MTVDDLEVTIHFVKENAIVSPDSRSSDKFLHGIKVLMAKNYEQHLTIVREFVDVETAKQSGRGGFGDMIASRTHRSSGVGPANALTFDATF